MDNFTYRKAEETDIPLILEVLEAQLREEGCWGEKMIELFMEGNQNSVPRRMEDETGVIYLAYSGQTFAGMGSLLIWHGEHIEGDSTLSNSFYTMPAFRGQGIMHQIADLLIQEAREHGCYRVTTCTEEKYRSEYHEMGFQDIYDYLEDEDFNSVWGLSDEMEMVLQ